MGFFDEAFGAIWTMNARKYVVKNRKMTNEIIRSTSDLLLILMYKCEIAGRVDEKHQSHLAGYLEQIDNHIAYLDDWYEMEMNGRSLPAQAKEWVVNQTADMHNEMLAFRQSVIEAFGLSPDSRPAWVDSEGYLYTADEVVTVLTAARKDGKPQPNFRRIEGAEIPESVWKLPEVKIAPVQEASAEGISQSAEGGEEPAKFSNAGKGSVVQEGVFRFIEKSNGSRIMLLDYDSAKGIGKDYDGNTYKLENGDIEYR